jgi:hypothetical protein
MLVPSHSIDDLGFQYYSINLIVKRICLSAFLLTGVVFPILSRKTLEVCEFQGRRICSVPVISNPSPRHSSLPIPNRSFVMANVPNTHRSKPNTNQTKEKILSNQKEIIQSYPGGSKSSQALCAAHPTFRTRLASKKLPPTRRQAPAKICAPRKGCSNPRSSR